MLRSQIAQFISQDAHGGLALVLVWQAAGW
jgi:hypothetical protein